MTCITDMNANKTYVIWLNFAEIDPSMTNEKETLMS